MKLSRGKVLPVLVGAVVVVGGANLAAYAGNGSPFILGKQNVEQSTSTLKNTGGSTPLSLKGSKTKPPLAVSSNVKVKKLNADSLDDLDSTALQNQVYRYTLPVVTSVGTFSRTFPNLPKGKYLASYTVSMAVDANTTNVGCELIPSNTSPHVAGGSSAVLNAGIFLFGAVSASGLVDTTDGSTWKITCTADDGGQFTTAASSQSEVDFLRVDTVTTASAG
jgi:hypothetical protein